MTASMLQKEDTRLEHLTSKACKPAVAFTDESVHRKKVLKLRKPASYQHSLMLID